MNYYSTSAHERFHRRATLDQWTQTVLQILAIVLADDVRSLVFFSNRGETSFEF
jgi:hypothetical protein